MVIARDAEGNGYAPFSDLSIGAYNERDYEVGLERLTKVDIAEGYTEEDVLKNGVPAIILLPAR